MTDDERTIRRDAAEPPGRDPASRLADHAEIARLADDLVPALVAKLGAAGLGELEVREGDWRVRLRMPAGTRPVPATGVRRAGRAAPSPHQAQASRGGPGAGALIGPGPETAPAEPGEPAVTVPGPEPHDRAAHRVVVTSPAVGFYRPRAGLSAGSRVRAGERLGVVDVLGVPHEIVSPEGGVLGAALVEPGEPVEYGQEIVIVERLPVAPPSGGQAAAAAGVTS